MLRTLQDHPRQPQHGYHAAPLLLTGNQLYKQEAQNSVHAYLAMTLPWAYAGPCCLYEAMLAFAMVLSLQIELAFWA